MARHAQLEAERVEEIIKQIGSSEPILLTDEFNDLRSVFQLPNLQSLTLMHRLIVDQGLVQVLAAAGLLSRLSKPSRRPLHSQLRMNK